MGFNVPISSWFATASDGPTLRIVTFNAGRAGTLDRLERFLAQADPDLVVIPECTFLEPEAEMVKGLHARRTHGVCVLSRFPFLEFDVRHPRDVWQLGGAGDISLSRVQTPFGPIDLLALHLETVRDDLDTLVMDAEVLEGLLDAKDPDKKSKEIEIKLIARLRKHKNNPKFVALGFLLVYGMVVGLQVT